MRIDPSIQLQDLHTKLDNFWDLSGKKILAIENQFDQKLGAPVFTVNGKYTSRGWTEWTQGFQFGSAILQFDATGDDTFLKLGKKQTLDKMSPHLTHLGVHDHGFNNISTYGNLLRLMQEGKIGKNAWEDEYYKLALKVSGAIQANRWTDIVDGGYIYSFNGPHSLFVDTIRSCRIVFISHLLGHTLLGENDKSINLFQRAAQHIEATAKYAIYYGEGRDNYDVPGRTAHESIFNTNDGNYRCPNAQQGYSGFTTWTRGLAWAICGFAEELELLDTIHENEFQPDLNKTRLMAICEKAAKATCDFYLEHSPIDGIPYWDTGAPGLAKMGDYLNFDSDPYNEYEPIDSSAACIAAQGFLRLSNYLKNKDEIKSSNYRQAGLGIASKLFDHPYLSEDDNHQGLILHSIYHRPNDWDHIPEGSKIPNGESSMWGDYHARELALYLGRLIKNEKYYSFFGCLPN